jgi:hypothetical protein
MFINVVDDSDMGMIQCGGSPRFARETLGGLEVVD